MPTDIEPHERSTRTLEDLRSQLLGYDVDPHDRTRLLDDYLAVRHAVIESGRRPLSDELELITVFADLAELSQNRPSEDQMGVEHVHSARENFHTYLQSLDVERDGLPQSFHDQLSRALAHYGVTDLDRTPELEAAVFRVFLALQNPSDSVTSVSTLLREWLGEPTPREELQDRVGVALDKLVSATQLRFPAIADLARGVVYSWYGQPLLRRNRPGCMASCANTCATSTPIPTPPTVTSTSPTWSAPPSRWSVCSASGWCAGSPTTRSCSRC